MEQARTFLICCAAIFCLAGCNTLGAGKQVKQLEMENNRLLSEFRAERQRRESAERMAQQLELRLAESEKMLARNFQTPASGQGRLSSLPLSPSSIPNNSHTNSASPNSIGSSSAVGSGLNWQRRN